MKKVIAILICQCSSLIIPQLSAQSLSPQVIASSGGYYANTAGSLSFTIGETNTQTLSSASHMLTQGFQQPFELHLIHLTAFLQGYYIGNGMMNDALYNQGEYINPSLVADSITIELHDATPPYAVAYSKKQTINQNGTTTIKGFGVQGQSYYIVLKHRNSTETWSALPVVLTSNTNYDFTDASTKAYGGNQSEVESGVWAIFAGDINQDLAVDAFDYVLLDPDLVIGASGYLSTDLNGDGSVDAFDYVLLDANLVNGVGAITP